MHKIAIGATGIRTRAYCIIAAGFGAFENEVNLHKKRRKKRNGMNESRKYKIEC